MPVLLAYAIEDSTDIFRISGGGGFEHPKPPLSVRHCSWLHCCRYSWLTFQGSVSFISGTCQQVLDDFTENRTYWELKEETLDRTFWRTRFRRNYEPVTRLTEGIAVCNSRAIHFRDAARQTPISDKCREFCLNQLGHRVFVRYKRYFSCSY